MAPPSLDFSPLAGSLAVAISWLAIGIVGLIPAGNALFARRIAFPASALVGLALAAFGLQAIWLPAAQVVLPLGLPDLPFHLRIDPLAGFFLTRLLTDPFTFFFLFWLPAYLQTSRGFTLGKTGMMAWIPYLGADLGALTGGAFSDWLVRRGVDPRRARRRILLVVACLTPLTLVAVRVGSVPLAVSLIVIVMFLQACWNTNLTTLIIESTPQQHVARVVALTLMGGTVGGSIATLLTGHVIKTFGYVPVFTALGFTHLIAYAIISTGLRRTDATHYHIAP